mgnify:CR=1 FL=1
MSLLHNVVWTERTVSLLRQKGKKGSKLRKIIDQTANGDLTPYAKVESAILGSFANCQRTGGTVQLQVSDSGLENIVHFACLIEPPVETTTADILLNVFYAGQDLILAGRTELCVLLYKRYHEWFHRLKQPSDHNRARMEVFLSSQGRINPFGKLTL